MQNLLTLKEIYDVLPPVSLEGITDKKIKEIEWFFKLKAVEAVNDENKTEFQEILKENNTEKFILFIEKYCPNIGNDLIKFLEEKNA